MLLFEYSVFFLDHISLVSDATLGVTFKHQLGRYKFIFPVTNRCSGSIKSL